MIHEFEAFYESAPTNLHLHDSSLWYKYARIHVYNIRCKYLAIQTHKEVINLHIFVCYSRPLFVYFRPFSQYNDKYSTKIDYKSEYGVLRIRTLDHRMIGAEESTELWWFLTVCISIISSRYAKKVLEYWFHVHRSLDQILPPNAFACFLFRFSHTIRNTIIIAAQILNSHFRLQFSR